MTRFDTILQKQQTPKETQPKVGVLDVLREVPGAAKKTALDVVRSIPRSVVTAGLAVTGQKEVTPNTPAQKLLFGAEPIKNVRGTGQDIAKGFGASDKTASRLAVPIGVLSTALDLYPGTSGKGKLAKEAVEQTAKEVAKPTLLKSIKNFIKPVETRIAEQGNAGKELKNIITRAADTGEVQAGKRVAELKTTPLAKLTRTERFNLKDVMEGKAAPLTGNVQKAFEVARKQTDELAQEAKDIGVQVKVKKTLVPPSKEIVPDRVVQRVNLGKDTGVKEYFTIPANKAEEVINQIDNARDASGKGGIAGTNVGGKSYHITAKTPAQMEAQGFVHAGQFDTTPKGLTPFQRTALEEGRKVPAVIRRPFQQRANYYPHQIPDAEQLTKGSVRKDIIENLVKQGVRSSPEEAGKFIDDYVKFIETGQRQDSLIQHLVSTGQAKNDAEALKNLQTFRQRTIKRQGSLEYARQVDLPFYDPDPARVLPNFVTKQSQRLEQIRNFGQDDQEINKLIKQVKDEGGDADTVRYAVDRILGKINERPGPQKASQLLRTLQGFKLGLAAIPNASQGVLNSLLKGDLPAVGYGLSKAFMKSGREFALKSGATLESTLQESVRESGSASKLLGKFLKATGFSATEKFNRTLAANAGKSYGTRLVKSLLKNPGNLKIQRRLTDLGLDVNKVLKNGLTDDDVLMMAKKFTDLTQFRSRPQDLPLFASSPEGKVFFQFKNFIYGQTRLLHNATLGELKSGNYGKAVRNLVVLATAFPMAGEAIGDIRSAITGKDRTTKGLERYFDDIAQVGALGVLQDLFTSGKFRSGTEFLAGPTLTEIGTTINNLSGPNKTTNVGKQVTKRLPLIGPLMEKRVFPDKKPATKKRFSL